MVDVRAFILCGALAMPSGVSAQHRTDFFLASAWERTCYPARERLGSDKAEAKDQARNDECVAYVMGNIDAALYLLMRQGRPCAPEKARRDVIFKRAVNFILDLPAEERQRIPTVAVVGEAVSDQCGLK